MNSTEPTSTISKIPNARWLALSAALLGVEAISIADESAKSRRPVDGIMDNSFLVEEAYNQEPGVVQHILTGFYGVQRQSGPDADIGAIGFTQEWPVFSQRHQFSYTVPYLFLDTGEESRDGFGDVLLNYRYQAYFDEESLRAFAPRVSLVLPTGRSNFDFSDDTVGGQLNLPFSSAWGNRWFTHFNAGLTFLPDARLAGDRDATHYNLGASAIYAATPDLHFLVEWTGNWLNVPAQSGGLEHEFVSTLSPGVRTALNFPNESQLVLGVAAPIGLNESTPDYGVFLYVSFEHFFTKRKQPN